MLRGTLVYWLLFFIFRFILRRQLRREYITMDEPTEKMSDVKVAYLEGDGQISVIRNSPSTDQPSPKRALPGA